MSGGGGSNTTTTTQSNAPWAPAQPYLKQILGGASNAYNSGDGFAPYPGSTVAPFSPQTTAALTGITDTANAGDPLAGASQNAALGIFGGGGLTPQGQQAAADLQPYASGAYTNGGSPEFQKALDTQAGKLTDDVNRTWSNAGRYGSAGQTNDLVDQVGNLRTGAMANEMAREQGNQINAAGQLAGVGNAASNSLLSFAGLSPSIYSQQYAPYTELAGAGNAYDTQAQNVLSGQVGQYNTQQQQPWNLLNAYMGAITGASAGSGTQTGTQTTPKPSPLQGLLSGGLLGGQIGSAFGPIGTGIGALGGGLLGFL